MVGLLQFSNLDKLLFDNVPMRGLFVASITAHQLPNLAVSNKGTYCMSCCIGASPLIGSILSFEGVMTATIGNTVDAGVAGVSRPLRLSTDSDEGSEISGLAGDRAGLSGKGI